MKKIILIVALLSFGFLVAKEFENKRAIVSGKVDSQSSMISADSTVQISETTNWDK